MLELSQQYQNQLKGRFITPKPLQDHVSKLIHDFQIQHLEDPFIWHHRYTNTLLDSVYPNINFHITTSGKFAENKALINILWDDIDITVHPLVPDSTLNIIKIYALLLKSNEVDFEERLYIKTEHQSIGNKNLDINFYIDNDYSCTKDYTLDRLEMLNHQLNYVLFYPPVINQFIEDSTHEDDDDIIRRYLSEKLYYLNDGTL